jgi:hypothetical protein
VQEPRERMYVAACPFCDYRRLFPSAAAMLAIYGRHLLDHHDEALEERQTGRRRTAQRAERIARHVLRLTAARYN